MKSHEIWWYFWRKPNGAPGIGSDPKTMKEIVVLRLDGTTNAWGGIGDPSKWNRVSKDR